MLQTIGNCFESISTFSVLRVYSKQILTVKVYEDIAIPFDAKPR